ncbi:GNAT family N-acetyltransferase [Maliponia aquimaris]|uniref:Ribosomal-protein-alanine N-acetyltransferase n=1 Tax=Maliponia aquimaris TaxID=1673631 RepID=A0A238K896_9RHOB|nr:GNAT family N-acetyltransferase [Maliponia aquimaris]SMX38312.1 ribosomal-protein-alanine N-acetyltransferase [Maliponia aquimaris]
MTPETLAALAARAYTHMRPWSAAQFAETLAGPHTLLAATGHAFVLGTVVAGEAEILALAADPEVQRQGEGTRALAIFHAEATARGATACFLEVAATNAPARAFYADRGYAEAGRRRGYYTRPDGTRDDAVIMTRTLP